MNRLASSLDRVGSAGALIAALVAPCCLPLFGAISGALGVTALGVSEPAVFYILQAFALLSLTGLTFAARRHHSLGPLLLGGASALALLLTFNTRLSAPVVYLGLAGLCAASILNYFLLHGCKSEATGVTLHSVITCPNCGHRSQETMPTNACLFFYDCAACGTRLKPKPGHCCVFCSYGSVPCPSIQSGSFCSG